MRIHAWIVGLLSAVAAAGCGKVPETERAQLTVIPNSVVVALGRKIGAGKLQGEQLETQTKDAQILNRVGERVTRAERERDAPWTYALIVDEDADSWAVPGGYVGVTTGMLPVLRNEAGMAFVVGHEVGHVSARHANERISHQLVLFGGLTGLNFILDGTTAMTGGQRVALLAALGVGTEVGVLLPFARQHETEADVLGMMGAARSGYPPEEAFSTLARMDLMVKKGWVPRFLSTHPTFEHRQEELRAWLPEAQKRYERNRLPYNTQTTRWPGAPQVSELPPAS